MGDYYITTRNRILSALLDKYESSKSFTGENRVTQSFGIKPDFIMPGYYSDFADIDEIRELNYVLNNLQAEGWVRLEKKADIIVRIVASEDRIPDYYAALKRIPKDKLREQRVAKYNSVKGKYELIDRFADSEIEKICCGYKTFLDEDELDDTVKLLTFVLENSTELLERELSILVLGDSKKFEKEYRHKICRILNDYATASDQKNEDFRVVGHSSEISDSRIWEIETLAEYMVVPNPSYVFFKGRGLIRFESGSSIELKPDISIAVSSQSLEKCTGFEIDCESVITVENLTSFNRMNCDGNFLIYLEGYHSKSKQKLLDRIIADNSDKDISFYHFGDIDPDGFMILRNLCNKTGVDFKPYRMGVKELQYNESALKPLTKLDVSKAESLLSQGLYTEVLEYMLEHNCKLEQEIVSLNIMNAHC